MKFKKIISVILALGLSVGSFRAFAETDAVAIADTALTAVCDEECTLPTLPENALEKYYGSQESPYISFYGAYDSTYEQRIIGRLSASQKKELEAEVRKIVGMVDNSWSDLKKALFINDYMTLTCEYDLTYTKYTAYDHLVERTAVCQGYAEAYWLLMNRLGIDCKIVTSTKLNHAWNLVKINGKWYHVDTTWNDPIPDAVGRAHHNNFLLSDEGIRNSGHDATDWRLSYEGSASAVGLAVDKTYDDYFWKKSDSAIPVTGIGFYYVNSDDYSLNFISDNGSVKEIIDLSDHTWYVKGKPGYYWRGAYSGCGIINDRLYFNTPTEIRSCSLNGGDIRTEYTLSAENAAAGDLYGLYILDTVIYYTIAGGPNSDYSYSQKTIDIFTNNSPLFGIIASSNYKNTSIKAQLSGGGKSFSADILNGKYSFKDIPDGIYVLNVSKPGHCSKEITVSVSSSAPIQLNDEIHLYGDANYDGVVDSKDATQILRYCSGLSSVLGNNDEYRMRVANVRKNGGVPAPQDATQILKYASTQPSVFDTVA